MATHSSILAWDMDRGAWRAAVRGVIKIQTQLSDSTATNHLAIMSFLVFQ